MHTIKIQKATNTLYFKGRRTATFLQTYVINSHHQFTSTRITRALATSANASLIPETHLRSYGQPVFETHPYALEKNERK
jgi:hypothetical protein